MNQKEYDVALSFAGEDRAYVEMIADGLRSRKIKVFYDRYEATELWGKDLYSHLTEVYKDKASYTVVFISKHYGEKLWTKVERRAAQARAFSENQEYILPARFDDTEIEGILPTVGYVDLRSHSPEEVCVLICMKLGHAPLSIKADSIPSPRSQSAFGIVRFDHTSHNGIFRIGDGMYLFETKWSRAGGNCVHCYNDPSSIRGVALAPREAKLADLKDVSILDFSSRTRIPDKGRIVVLQNDNGFYAALEIVDVKDDMTGDSENELFFRYWILANGSADFSAIEAENSSLATK
jgi:hypothetical protein